MLHHITVLLAPLLNLYQVKKFSKCYVRIVVKFCLLKISLVNIVFFKSMVHMNIFFFLENIDQNKTWIKFHKCSC